MAMIAALILVTPFLSLLAGSVSEWAMTESVLAVRLELNRVLRCHADSPVIGVIVKRHLFELDHEAHELLYAIAAMDNARRFPLGR